jgi:hypothetical protein
VGQGGIALRFRVGIITLDLTAFRADGSGGKTTQAVIAVLARAIVTALELLVFRQKMGIDR